MRDRAIVRLPELHKRVVQIHYLTQLTSPQKAQEVANRKRSEAAKAQLRTEKGVYERSEEPVAPQTVEQPDKEKRRDKTNQAKAAAKD